MRKNLQFRLYENGEVIAIDCDTVNLVYNRPTRPFYVMHQNRLIVGAIWQARFYQTKEIKYFNPHNPYDGTMKRKFKKLVSTLHAVGIRFNEYEGRLNWKVED